MVDCCVLSQECAVVFPSAVGGYFHHTSPKRQRRSRPDESPCRKPQAVIKNINFVDSLPLASVDFPIAAYTSRMLDFFHDVTLAAGIFVAGQAALHGPQSEFHASLAHSRLSNQTEL